ncbi:MAG: hypothetical protein AABY64_03325 [Bdellovibrionota bacterium]
MALKMQFNKTMKSLKFTILTLVFAISAQSWAESFTLLYSGTFDAFHRTHAEEVEGALKMFPGSKALVLPIQRAPHTPRVEETGRFQPTFLPYNEIIDIIQASTKHNPNIQTHLGLQEMVGINSAVAQSQATKNLPGERKAHLVGSDILKVWEQKNYLEELLKTAMIVVSADPTDMKTFEAQKAKYGHDPRIRFIHVVSESVRSTDLRIKSLSSDGSAWTSLLAKGAIEALNAKELHLSANGQKYVDNMRVFAQDFFLYKLWPHIEKLNLEPAFKKQLLENKNQQINLMSYVFSKFIEGKETLPENVRELPWVQEIAKLKENIAFRNALIDAARTIKTLRATLQSSSAGLNMCHRVFSNK